MSRTIEFSNEFILFGCASFVVHVAKMIFAFCVVFV